MHIAKSRSGELVPFQGLLGGCLLATLAVQDVFEHADADQVKMMEERVILVDEKDRVIGAATKKECELAHSSEQLACDSSCVGLCAG